MSETTPFGEALLGIMGRRGFTRADIVRRTGYSFSRVTRLLNGGIKINAEVVNAISYHFDLTNEETHALMRAAALTHGFLV
jgi:transcriptional regulator with XRE-family HTH domain